MINQEVIKNFLVRKLNSYDWMKKETKSSLMKEVTGLLPTSLIQKMWVHQLVCFLILLTVKRFMIYIDMGGGKSFLTLLLLLSRKFAGEKPKAIVFVPYITSVKTWIDEVEKHTPQLICCPLIGTTTDNLYKLQAQQADLFVICYQSAVAMLADQRPSPKHKKKKWHINPKKIRKVFAGFDTIVCDEIHKTKNQQSITYKMCRAISGMTEYAIGLTGTPFGRDLQDLWPQFYLIDFGETLGPTLGFYRSVFFNEKINYWGGFEYKFKKPMMPTLKKVIKNSSIRYSMDELHDLPPRQFITQEINLPDAISSYAKLAADKLKQAIANPKNEDRQREAEASYMQLRQLSSGFMTVNGEDNNKIQIKFDENPKLDALQDLIEAMPYGCKMVVFHWFIASNQIISDRLKAMKVKHARVWGGQKNVMAELNKFQKDDDCKVLVINSKSGSSSLNLQNANYCVFYEQVDSSIDRQQAERRVWRPGQIKKVLYYDLFVNGTVDKRMHGANQQGKNLLRELLDGKAKV